MSIPKKGSRTITVDGVPYRWRIRHKPTYRQGIGIFGLNLAVEHAEHSGATLVIKTGKLRPDAWTGDRSNVSVTPSYVASIIRLATNRGWKPEASGDPFVLWMREETGPGVPTLQDVDRVDAH